MAIAPHLASITQGNLIVPGRLRAPLVLARGPVGTRATAIGAEGAWIEHGPDAPRFVGSARRLLIEGARANGVRNPQAEAAAAGTPGTLPTHWGLSGLPSGITSEVVGVVVVGGVHCLRLRMSGTPAASGTARIEPEGLSAIVASNGQTWTASLFYRLAAGSTANLALTHRVMGRNGSFGALALVSAPMAPDENLQRQAVTTTLAGAGIAYASTDLTLGFTAGQAVDFTLDIGLPQLEQGAFASTPILPPVGSPGAATRGADLVAAALDALGIRDNGACTLLLTAVIPQIGAERQTLLQIDDGTNNNRFILRNPSGGNLLVINRALGGPTGTNLAVGSMTPGVPFRAGISIDGAGRIAASLDGGAVVGMTGGPTAGLRTLRIGGEVAGAGAWFGEVGLLQAIPYALPDAALRAEAAP